MNTQWMFAVMLALGLNAAARAQTTPPPDTDKDNPPKQQDLDNKGADRVADRIAKKFNVPEAEVLALRKQGLGWGEISHALAIAERAKVPVADVLKLRQSGLGWGEIAQKYGFKLGDVTGKAKAIEKEGRKADRDEERRERGEGRRDARMDAERGGHEHGSGADHH